MHIIDHRFQLLGFCMRFSFALVLLIMSMATTAYGQAGCGYVSVSSKPPLAKDFYPVVLQQIDGAQPAQRSGRIKLGVGVHTILVQQQIAGESRGRSQLKKRGISDLPQTPKSVDVDVQADGHYLIAAKLVADAGNGDPSDHWEPVVWRKLLESCQ